MMVSKSPFEVTCRGREFPSPRSRKGPHLKLKNGMTHAHRHAELKGTDASDSVPSGVNPKRATVRHCLRT